jgi:hypothetical protein
MTRQKCHRIANINVGIVSVKRNSHFDTLSNEEIARMDRAVQSACGNATSSAE